jgi:thioredoxin 1
MNITRNIALSSLAALMIATGCSRETPPVAQTESGEPAATEAAQVEVSAAEFKQAVSGPGLVIAKFGAPWCGPCREVEPELDKLEAENAGKLTVVRVNVDDEPGLAQEYEVSAIPVILLFKDGQQVEQWLGYKEAAELQASIDKQL